ncbi:hypothetical protein [Pontibacter oryzae]|uniref:Lipocalin-like domain-containing protein n=1 Tax=Pontibacter oryzae TaxID=2304593 RepID=A0A399SFE8_9BACT|nr:hypothetical protein [Pontibacter oryzae]RIJ41928.1 hypothetical protein D1627_07950 [Pontibacter oryzae]
MNKLRFLPLLLLCFFVITLTSCDKDEKDDVSPNMSLITAGTWTGSAIYIDGENITNEFEEETGLDFGRYTSKFERDGTYTDTYDGRVVVEGTWEYGNNERIVIFEKGTTNKYEVVISKLDEDEFFYQQSGIEYRFKR